MTEPSSPPDLPTSSPESKSKRSLWRKLIKGLGIFLVSVVGLILILAIVLAAWPDSDPPDDSAMLPAWDETLTVNPLSEFEDRTREIFPEETRSRSRDILAFDGWDGDEVDLLLSDSAELIAEFDALADQVDEPWQWRLGEALAHPNPPKPSLEILLAAATLVEIRAIRSAELGQTESSLHSIRALLAIGQSLDGARGGLLEHILAVTVLMKATAAIEKIAEMENLDLGHESWLSLIRDLGKYERLDENFSFALKAEYLSFKRSIELIRSGDLEALGSEDALHNTAFLQENDTLRLYLGWAEPVTASIEQGWSATRTPLEKMSEGTMTMKANLPRLFVNSNPVGRILVTLFLPAQNRLVSRHFETRAELRAWQVKLALLRHRQQEGSLPKDLSVLVPSILPEIPTDPFSNQPMRWLDHKDGPIIYSVGPDGIDNGGEIDGPSYREDRDVGIYLESEPREKGRFQR